MEFQSKVRTCLWFDGDPEAAAEFYVSLLPDSKIDSVNKPDPNGPAFIVEFTLAGAPFMILNGGPHYQLTPAASISVLTKSQQETDTLWASLTADGGEERMCGWIVDRFGVSWQIIPEKLVELINHSDHDAAARARDAMMKMNKIDIAALQAAFNG